MSLMFYLGRLITMYVITLLIAGCASYLVPQDEKGPIILASHSRVVALDVNECRKLLSKNNVHSNSKLDSTSIDILSWNIKKGQMMEWREDFLDLAEEKDLVLIQEAVLNSNLTEAFNNQIHWSFSTGYKTNDQVTGVMTFSSSEPLTQCNLTSWEPWLGTPKATSITEYGLSGTHETLVVVNIHAINFTFGVSKFEQQINQIHQVLADHNGPIILAGDINTWRKKRMDILEALAKNLGLDALSFQQDYRKSVFSHHLDHIYVRALTTESTKTYSVKSSDHNPLLANFRF